MLLTVKAVPTVNSFPCITYTKKAVTDTRVGAMLQTKENSTLLIRARMRGMLSARASGLCVLSQPLIIHCISTSRASIARLIHRSSHAKNLINFT